MGLILLGPPVEQQHQLDSSSKVFDIAGFVLRPVQNISKHPA